MSILELTKAKLGITSNKRDVYLSALIEAAIGELKRLQGIRADIFDEADVKDFVADLVAYKYRTHDPAPMPEHLKERRRLLWLKYAGRGDDVEG